MSEWINTEIEKPPDTNEVIVTDGYDSYAIAWFKPSDQTWNVSTDILEASNYDGGCHIEVCHNEIKYWKSIPVFIKPHEKI